MKELTQSPIFIGVISSLVASLIFWIVLPLIKKFISKIIILISNQNNRIKNKIYKKAATRTISHSSDHGLLLSLILFLTSMNNAILTENLSFKTEWFDEDTTKILLLTTIVIVTLFYQFRWVYRDLIIRLTRQNDNKLELIRAFIDDKTYYLLKGQWINMESYDDYMKMQNTINSILKEIKENDNL